MSRLLLVPKSLVLLFARLPPRFVLLICLAFARHCPPSFLFVHFFEEERTCEESKQQLFDSTFKLQMVVVQVLATLLSI